MISVDEDIPEGKVMAALPQLPGAYAGISTDAWRGPYLSADDATIAKWSVFAKPRRIRLMIGVAWKGNPKQGNNARRSFDVAQLAPLFEIHDIALVSLQKGPRDELAGTPIIHLGEDYQNGDWLDTAGVIANLDLVISPCTSIAHLAGGMGKPVWLARFGSRGAGGGEPGR